MPPGHSCFVLELMIMAGSGILLGFDSDTLTADIIS